MPRSNRFDDRHRSPERERSQRYHTSNDDDTIFRIPPFFYIHVLNHTTNVSSVEVGPQTFVRQDNQRVVMGPDRMLVVPPRHYCIISNPVCRNEEGYPILDRYGQAKLNHGELEIKLSQEPFPLYPGEILMEVVTPLKVVPANSALRLRAVLDYIDDGNIKRIAGDEWLFEGPGTYIPRKETLIEEAVRASIIGPGQALKLRARKDYVDRNGISRVTGELWLVKKTGAYLPSAYDEVLDLVNAYVLTEKIAVHMKATKTFVDDFGIDRKNGEEWLITMADTESHIPNVYEELVSKVNILTLTNRQYCVILNAVGNDGKPQFGRKKLVRGEKSFFLMPGETLECGIQNVYVLEEDEGLILRANESFTEDNISKRAGDRWMIKGPAEYVPPVQVEVVTKRKATPLDETEGLYVRDVKTGRVRMIHGQTYMLNQDEELWEKELPHAVEVILASDTDPLADRASWRLKNAEVTQIHVQRDKTRVVTFRVPHNATVQIYDYKEKKPRVIFGPELVMLGPDEQFTQLSLSGGTPKKPNAIKAICLLLGPDFCTDAVVVETADHAKLSIQLAYNWHFDVPSRTPEEASKLFSVPDFIGDSCKAIASKIRGAVAQVKFDTFHKNSSRVIRSSVFGLENDKVRESLRFTQNNLVITSVDIQSVEPVDQRTRDALQKSVQLAIEITTKSQEATAKQEAERLEQEARGRLERQRIMDEAEAEKARKCLIELQANSAAVESTGQAKAEAQSKAEASRIEGEAAVLTASLQAEASAIETDSELNRLKRARTDEIEFISEKNRLEISKLEEISHIDINKFKEMVEAIGSSTLQSMASAGPDLQVRMLKALGLKSTLITDGSSPINLFNTASGLIGGDLVPKKRRRVEVNEPVDQEDVDSDTV